jgi:hypothetical protein
LPQCLHNSSTVDVRCQMSDVSRRVAAKLSL